MNHKKIISIVCCVVSAILILSAFVCAQDIGSSDAISEALDFIERNKDVPFDSDVSDIVLEEDVVVVSDEDLGESDQEEYKGNPGLVLDVLELKDMDIVDVLKLISKKSGLNIVAGKNVRGRVTIYLKNVDVRDALRIILESNDLAYVEENGIIKVLTSQDFDMIYGYKFGQKTQTKIIQLEHAKAADILPSLNQVKSNVGKIAINDNSNTLIVTDKIANLVLMEELIERADIPIFTEVFVIRYSKADKIAGKLEGLLTPNVGKVEFDERSNKLFITDTKDKMREIAKLIKAFDEKHPEVLIEAKIVQVTLSDTYKMGVDWEAIVSGYHTLDLTSEFDVLATTDKRGTLGIGTISNDDYKVLVEALSTAGDTKILSNPRIAVINNEEAKILVGSSEPYVTSETITPSSGPVTTAESVNFIEVGVKLFVTPTIHGDGYITMKIKPEVSSRTGYVTTSTNNEIPIVETSEAETTVMAKDGVTIVIGGLIKEQDEKTIKKVPLLGDIPFLGFVFRSESKSVTKTEIVIFLTPKIVTGDKPTKENVGIKN